MNVQEKLKEIVNQLFLNTGASFSGIFIDGKPPVSKTIYPEKKEKLEEILKLTAQKAHQINEFIDDFGEEYVYAEGEDVSIFIYFFRKDIAIASVIETKPKFALLKLEHTTVANKLRSIENDLDDYIKGVVHTPEKTEEIEESEIELESLEEVMPELKEEEPEKKEEKFEITVDDVKDRFAQEIQEIEKTENLEELEKVLSQPEEPPLEEILKPVEEVQQKEITEEKPQEKQEEKKFEQQIEIVSEEGEYYDPQVLEKIQRELLKEIGPVGKFLFKKRIKQLNIDEEKITRTVLSELINELSNDIIDEKRKKRFVEKVSAFL